MPLFCWTKSSQKFENTFGLPTTRRAAGLLVAAAVESAHSLWHGKDPMNSARLSRSVDPSGMNGAAKYIRLLFVERIESPSVSFSTLALTT